MPAEAHRKSFRNGQTLLELEINSEGEFAKLECCKKGGVTVYLDASNSSPKNLRDSWKPVEYSSFTLLKRERPTCTERKSLTKECGWKDGDRGGPARTQRIHR
jgi:hypothetical protein